MKTMLLTLAACAGLTSTSASFAASPDLVVHEWGTFTIVSGSDGRPLSWYQPGAELDQLPLFVNSNPFGSKAAFRPSLLRMETPVIYFYPKQPMPLKVSVSFPQGRITEWFPAPRFPPAPNTVWEGTLHPPDDADTLKRVPEIAARGTHYGHARSVPDAWLFRSTIRPQPADLPVPFPHHDAEKFIFYRGTGEAAPPLATTQHRSGGIQVRRTTSGEPLKHAFLLSVKSGKTAWMRMPLENNPATKWSPAAEMLHPEPEADLPPAMVDALVQSGLTRPEATAMVATWQGQWFREPGTRVLAILPRKDVDAMLPLTISPKPDVVERVFVARLEVLTTDREQELLTLLDDPTTPQQDATLAARFRALEFGRFGRAVLQRAQELQNVRMAQRFESLEKAATTIRPQATAQR